MINIAGSKIILHNLTFRGIEVVPGVLDFDQRGLVYTNDGDVVITKSHIEEEYLSYLEDLGWKFNSCKFINPVSRDGYAYNSIFHDKHLISTIKKLDGYYLDTYNCTSEEENFSQKVSKKLYANCSLSQIHGTKSGFRKLARLLDLRITQGYESIQDVAALEKSIDQLCAQGIEEMVIKIDEAISGAGTTRVKVRAYEKLSKSERNSFLKQSLTKIKQAQNTSGVVVEQWRSNVIASPSVQVEVLPSGSWKIVSMHDQLLEGEDKWYVGCAFPQRALDETTMKKVLHDVQTYTQFLISEGFIGFFGLDLIITNDSQMYWIEANMRKPGTFYPRVIAEKLNNGSLDGVSYIASDFIVSKLKGEKFSQLRRTFENLLYPVHNRKEGVILYNVGALHEGGRFDVLCIGPSQKKAESIYNSVKRMIKKINVGKD